MTGIMPAWMGGENDPERAVAEEGGTDGSAAAHGAGTRGRYAFFSRWVTTAMMRSFTLMGLVR